MTAKKKRVEHYLHLLFEYVEQISKFMVSIILCNKLIILCTGLRNRLLQHTYILLLSSTLSANSGARHTLYSCQYYAESILATVKQKNKEGME